MAHKAKSPPTRREPTMAAQEQQEQGRLEETVRQVLRTPGSPIDAALRARLERCFGRAFGSVRLHTDDLAAGSARSLNARAWTAGSHIVFGQGRYGPETPEGRWLLCHELAHVVQQAGEFSPTGVTVGGAGDPLERAADRAADMVAAGRSLATDFFFGFAPAGVIQRHEDTPCPGTVVTPNEPGRQGIGGNWAIEIAYKEDPQIQDHVDALFFGSQYEGERFDVDVLLPRGAPNKAFGNMLLTRLRGLQKQRRPDIIDFKRRVFYEIKTPQYASDGMVQLESYYKIANEIIHEYARFHEPPWDRGRATWYPRHALPYPGDWRAIVCTQATDHRRFPGLILYDIRKKPGRRRDAENQAVRAFDTVRIDSDFDALAPRLVEEARKQIPYYDPAEPRYVIIMPREIYKKWPRKQNPLWEKLRVQPTYGDAPGGSYVKHVKSQLLVVTAIVTVVGIVLLLVVAGAVVVFAISAAVAAAAATAAEAAVATEAAVAADAAVEAAVATEAAAEADVISMSAWRAAKAAPAVQQMAKAAGVLFVLGTVSNADAANPAVDSVDAIRVVPVGEFELFGTPIAGSGPDTVISPVLHSLEATRGKFELGSFVQYDGKEHIVIGQIAVR